MAFEDAFLVVIRHEGGYTNDPSDHGGPTNYGLTLQDLSTYRGYQCSINDIRELSIPEAKLIYQSLYWNPMQLTHILSDKIQTAMFDQGVLSGIRTAVERIQAVVGVTVDGVMGPDTLRAVNNVPEELLLIKFISAMQLRYCSICVNDQTQIGFLQGWISRTQDLLLL